MLRITPLELPDPSQKDMDHQSSVLLCLGIDFFSFLQTFHLSMKKPVLTNGNKAVSLPQGNC